MRKTVSIIAVLVSIAGFSIPASAQDTYDTVKQRGVLIGGVKDSTPGFGLLDPKSREITGYDVDVLKYIAAQMGVKLQLKPVVSSTRIPRLLSGDIDIIAATMTVTPERSRQIDFSYAYFLTKQKFVARKGAAKNMSDLEGKRIGSAEGSTSVQNAAKVLPKATMVPFNDYPQAFLALERGEIAAVTTDEPILANLLTLAANKDQYEISEFAISDEPYALGIRKGSPKFLKFVNDTLLEMEKNGEAERVFEKWFGPKSVAPLKRSFVIKAGK